MLDHSVQTISLFPSVSHLIQQTSPATPPQDVSLTYRTGCSRSTELASLDMCILAPSFLLASTQRSPVLVTLSLTLPYSLHSLFLFPCFIILHLLLTRIHQCGFLFLFYSVTALPILCQLHKLIEPISSQFSFANVTIIFLKLAMINKHYKLGFCLIDSQITNIMNFL